METYIYVLLYSSYVVFFIKKHHVRIKKFLPAEVTVILVLGIIFYSLSIVAGLTQHIY